MQNGPAVCAVSPYRPSHRGTDADADLMHGAPVPSKKLGVPGVTEIRSEESLDQCALVLCERQEYAAATKLILDYHAEGVRAFLRGRTKDASVAEDVYSIFCENLWKGLRTFRFDGKLSAWVFIVARNALAKHMRSKARWYERHVFLPPEETDAHSSESDDMPSLNHVHLESLVSELPTDDRTLLRQRVLLAMNWNDIAQGKLPPGKKDDADAVVRESARLRKHYQVLVRKLRKRLSANQNDLQVRAI